MEYTTHLWEYREAVTRPLFSGSSYAIAFVLHGACHFEWEGALHPCGAEDLLLLQPGQSATLHFSGGRYPLAVLWVLLPAATLAALSSAETDLEYGFNVVPFRCTVVRVGSEILMLTKNLAQRLHGLPCAGQEYGAELFEEGLLKMFVVLVLRACVQAEQHQAAASRRHLILDEVFIYIGAHLNEELTLADLEREFYVDRCHIAREFKRCTGQTIHQYILRSRLDVCCRYIEQGLPITEVYRRGGFGSYNHFFRVFKQVYGLTPKAYYRAVRAQAHAANQPDTTA